MSNLRAALKGRSVINGLSRALGVGVILAGGALMTSCHSAVTDGRSPVIVVIDSLEAASVVKAGGGSPNYFPVLQSDVITSGSIFEDLGKVTAHIELKDITQKPTSNNLVTFNHYRVVFRRTDGRNVQGVDVPYAFEGGLTFTITTAPTIGAFTLVRAQSKLEPPLIQLEQFGGGSLLISTIADVTFYGKDTTGEEVSVTGSISVNFANWGDPQ